MDLSGHGQEMRTTMAKQRRMPRFTDGQRVRVVLLRDSGEPKDGVPARLLRYHGMVGYVTEYEHIQSETQSFRYDVFITKIGVNLALSEECLESAESRESARS